MLTAAAGHHSVKLSQVACMFDTITMSIAQNTEGGQQQLHSMVEFT